MNEADTRYNIIDGHLKYKGWQHPNLRTEYPITLGRIRSDGRRGKKLTADYVFICNNQIVAVLEAKRTGLHVTEGVAQAIQYAQYLHAPTAYASNGHTLYKIDMATGTQEEITWDDFPTPDTVERQTRTAHNALYNDLCTVDFASVGQKWTPRYYQTHAIQAVLKAISENKNRILLTLATGTGKTVIAAQIAHKLHKVKWTVGGHPRDPRILFLADRNVLADQAYNAFSIFKEDARIRISTKSIRKHKGELPTNGTVFFTIFQTFMSGEDTETETANTDNTTYNFHQYPADFFDLIFIDECHRGGANDQSHWRDILEYFTPAIQVGLTATPKRDVNGDTYAYFGDPVYVYTLKHGIQDGFLTPYKLHQITSTIDTYKHAIDNLVKQGTIDPDEEVNAYRLATDVYIEQRETERVKQVLNTIKPNDKTLIFCGTIERAGIIRDIVNTLHPTPSASYCQRVTANDGTQGDVYLRQFQDNEKTIPTILTTSRKLSTGVDALNIRNIVIMRPVQSMIEFKQIIGRGTRLYEGKAFFTIYDFENAYTHFKDPEWDGEPLPPDTPNLISCTATEPKDPEPMPEPPPIENDPDTRETVIISLSNANAREITFIKAISYINPDGELESTQTIINRLCQCVREICPTEEDLRDWWQNTHRRQTFLTRLKDEHFDEALLKDIVQSLTQQNIDIFDVFAHLVFNTDIKTRSQRVQNYPHPLHHNAEIQQFIEFVLSQYEKSDDICILSDVDSLLHLKYGTTTDAIRKLGGSDTIKNIFTDISKKLWGCTRYLT